MNKLLSYSLVAVLSLGANSCTTQAVAAEKMVDREGKTLYYLHENGRVSDQSGKTVGYLKDSGTSTKLTDPGGKTIGTTSDRERDRLDALRKR